MTVSERIVAQLAAAGVRRAYTVPGESFLPLLDACDRHPDIALISTRHESGAAFMAEADAKVTGRPALAMATRGVGAANLSIGVHTAYQDSTPMVVILGQVESAFLGREAFQEVDLPSFYREITKWAVTAPSSERVPELVGRAIHIATSGRPGPVMVAVPADLFEGDPGPEQSHLPGVVDRGRATPSERTSERIAEVLRDADAPVMIAGGGGRDARDALVTAAERFGLGVYASFRRQDVFPNDHPNYCGPLVLSTPPETLRALDDADVVFVVGCRLSEITTQGYRLPRADQRVIQIDVEPNSVGAVVPVELGLVADAREALTRDPRPRTGPAGRPRLDRRARRVPHSEHLRRGDRRPAPPGGRDRGTRGGVPALGRPRQRRGELLDLRAPLLAVLPSTHPDRTDERRDGVRRPGRHRRQAGRSVERGHRPGR